MCVRKVAALKVPLNTAFMFSKKFVFMCLGVSVSLIVGDFSVKSYKK